MMYGTINGLNNEMLLYIIIAMAVLILLAYVIAVVLVVRINNMKKTYKQMMTGSNSVDLEKMLMEHIDKVEKVMEENAEIETDNRHIHNVLKTVIQKVGIVRFSAFKDVGGDLSYAVALLDETNTGIILSSIFSRSSSNTYLKPIDRGNSTYKLSDEEQEALNKAMMCH
ncbi:DUF4446 family protein [Pectinatus frisingensis]|uniref:DUF4446 family protein n=1 Tax=Pectinatus frisingensis TaxID=865 RepID=UPI0018C7FCFC|nr:DUF4446 family protein [Pectinatus frisingensis]